MAVNKIQNIGGEAGGVMLVDINPEKSVTENFDTNNGFSYEAASSSSAKNPLVVQGYKKVAFRSNDYLDYYYFVLKDGTTTSSQSLGRIINTWTDYIDIPQDAMRLIIGIYATVSGRGYLWYSLLA